MDEQERNIRENELLGKNNEEPKNKAGQSMDTERHYYSIGQRVNVDPARVTPQPEDYTRYDENQNITQSQDGVKGKNNNFDYLAPSSQISEPEHVSAQPIFKVTGKKTKKLNTIIPYFLMFIASVLVVGMFMFLSDKMNWFTANEAVSAVNKATDKTTAATKTEGNVASYLEDRPDNISELFKAASPAVVKIETYSQVQTRSSSSLFNDPFFRQFFGDSVIPEEKQNQEQGELQQTGMGTGFFFDEAGYILTNQHVVGDATEIRVIVEGYDEPFVAELLGSSFDLDLAVLKLNEDIKFPTLELGDSDNVDIGNWVVAIGNPYGFDHTLTVGVISAKERPINIYDESGERNYKNLLQTDASINPGNSGGPLLNLHGQVIGINTAVSSQAQGIGFAIPTSTISEVLEMLKNNEEIPAEPIPFVGIRMAALTEQMLEGTGLTKAEGVRIENIVYGSPAYTGGLNQYDIITKIDDKVIKTTDDVSAYIVTKNVGDMIEMHVIRRGEEVVIPIEVGDQNNYQVNQ